jgi:hypothetical protein
MTPASTPSTVVLAVSVALPSATLPWPEMLFTVRLKPFRSNVAPAPTVTCELLETTFSAPASSVPPSIIVAPV